LKIKPSRSLSGGVDKNIFSCLIACCDVRWNFCLKQCSVRLYPHLICSGFMFYLCYYLRILVSNTISISIMLLSFNSNTAGGTSGAGTATILEHLSSRRLFSKVRLAKSLALFVVFCRSLFVLFILSVLRVAASDYHFLHLQTFPKH
jgi:hypothetical protein